MGMWFFCFLLSMLVPAIMVIFGARFTKKPPKRINYMYGYRTKRSMKNIQTWEFAHQTIGKIWYRSGIVSGILIMIGFLFVLVWNVEMAEPFCGIAAILEIVLLLVSYVPAEQALKKNFTDSGKRIRK